MLCLWGSVRLKYYGRVPGWSFSGLVLDRVLRAGLVAVFPPNMVGILLSNGIQELQFAPCAMFKSNKLNLSFQTVIVFSYTCRSKSLPAILHNKHIIFQLPPTSANHLLLLRLFLTIKLRHLFYPSFCYCFNLTILQVDEK